MKKQRIRKWLFDIKKMTSPTDPFKLDRTAFTIRKHGDEQAENREYWLSKTPAERLAAAWYLTCRAWNIDPNNPPRMDKTAFSIRKRPD